MPVSLVEFPPLDLGGEPVQKQRTCNGQEPCRCVCIASVMKDGEQITLYEAEMSCEDSMMWMKLDDIARVGQQLVVKTSLNGNWKPFEFSNKAYPYLQYPTEEL